MPPKVAPLPTPDFQNEATLFSLACEFLEAARTLNNSPPALINYRVVTYYLAGHAAELNLKSFLFKGGVSIDDLRKRYGHDLKLLVRCARNKGLSSRVSTEQILSLGSIYSRKLLEYRQSKQLKFPSLDLLLEEVRGLEAEVFNHVAYFQPSP